MARLLVLMGVLVALLSACGPPTPGIQAEVAEEQDPNEITAGR